MKQVTAVYAYGLVNENPNEGTLPNLAYRLGPSPRALWDAVIGEELFGTGYTRSQLEARGWRVVRVRVEWVA